MRADRLSNACVALVVGLAAASLVACGSSNKNSGSKIHVDGGAGSGGSAGSSTGGTGGQAAGGSGGQATGGSGGQAAGGSGGQAAGTGGTASCSDYGQPAACKTCLQKDCCAESAACAADAACKAFVACNQKCPNPLDTTSSCVQACVSQNNPGGSYNTLLVCMQQKCGAAGCTYL